MPFDRGDVCEGYYMFAALYHGGQFSEEYRIFGRLDKIGYKPSPLLRYDTMSEGAREVFDRLVYALPAPIV